MEAAGADQGSASMSARATAMTVCLSSSPLLLRSLLLWVWPAVEVPSPLLGLANTNFRLAKLSPFGSRAGRRECLNLACTYEPTASALPLSHLLRKLGWADDATMKSGSGLAPALFVCCPFVYFTPAQKGGCSNANSSDFDHHHRSLCGDSGP